MEENLAMLVLLKLADEARFGKGSNRCGEQSYASGAVGRISIRHCKN